MQKLFHTLYITEPGCYFSIHHGEIIITEAQTEQERFPLCDFHSIVACGSAGMSTELLDACMKNDISVSFLSAKGRFLTRLASRTESEGRMRKMQYQLSEDPDGRLSLARLFLKGKIYASRWVLERAARDYPQRCDEAAMREKALFLKNALSSVCGCTTAEELEALQLETERVFFSSFNELILQQKDTFTYCGGIRSAVPDRVTALLNFTYEKLEMICLCALECVGLDPWLGFLHHGTDGVPPLVRDLAAELRPSLADRFVLSVINKRIIHADDFTLRENGSFVLKPEALRVLSASWNHKRKEQLVHPVSGEKIEWGMAAYAQALLLARYLRGESEEYKPFLWKS